MTPQNELKSHGFQRQPHSILLVLFLSDPRELKEDGNILEKPYPARFFKWDILRLVLIKWAKEVKHDPNIFFAGEEINLTVRSFTHGYDLFHPHRVVIWHATMREERAGKLVWG